VLGSLEGRVGDAVQMSLRSLQVAPGHGSSRACTRGPRNRTRRNRRRVHGVLRFAACWPWDVVQAQVLLRTLHTRQTRQTPWPCAGSYGAGDGHAFVSAS
jgi:hypothetical protein